MPLTVEDRPNTRAAQIDLYTQGETGAVFVKGYFLAIYRVFTPMRSPFAETVVNRKCPALF